MTDKRILFGDFEFLKIQGLEYLLNEEKPVTDYLFVNEPNERFSMYFEEGLTRFTVPNKTERDYSLFEMSLQDRRIKFFCPEKNKGLDSVVWYFCVELIDGNGTVHELPGQVRVAFESDIAMPICAKPRFIEVLEQVKLSTV